MTAEIRELSEKHNSIDYSLKTNKGYTKVITYPDAEKALGEFISGVATDIRNILCYDDVDELQKMEQLEDYFEELQLRYKNEE